MTTLRPRAQRLRARSLTISPRLVIAFVALAAVALRVWTPDDDRAGTVCVFRRCTGASCPGCGLTRGMAYLMRGDVAASWQNHPLAILIMIETLLATALYLATTSGRVRFDWLRVGTMWLAAHIPLLLGVWAIRIVTGTLPT
jgi:hypothetical protein